MLFCRFSSTPPSRPVSLRWWRVYRRMLSRSSAAIRHLVWCVAFLGFLLLPIVSSTAPKWRVLPGWLGAGGATASVEEIGMWSAQQRASSNPSGAAPRDLAHQLVAAPAALETDSTSSIAVGSPEQPVTKRWFRDLLRPSRLVLVVWSFGFGLLLLRTLCSRFILQSRVALGRCRRRWAHRRRNQ